MLCCNVNIWNMSCLYVFFCILSYVLFIYSHNYKSCYNRYQLNQLQLFVVSCHVMLLLMCYYYVSTLRQNKYDDNDSNRAARNWQHIQPSSSCLNVSTEWECFPKWFLRAHLSFSNVCHGTLFVSQETASSSAECSRDEPPFSFVRGQYSIMSGSRHTASRQSE